MDFVDCGQSACFQRTCDQKEECEELVFPEDWECTPIVIGQPIIERQDAAAGRYRHMALDPLKQMIWVDYVVVSLELQYLGLKLCCGHPVDPTSLVLFSNIVVHHSNDRRLISRDVSLTTGFNFRF